MSSSSSDSPRPLHIRTRPRISVNKLGEYLVATVSRRRQIIRDQKYPPEVKTARYADVQRAVVDHLVNSRDESGILSRHLHRLVEWEPGPDVSKYKVQQNLSCREAIKAFSSILHELPSLDGFEVLAGPSDAPRLDLSGVAVSVRPEITLQGVDHAGRPTAGFIKLYFSKSFALDDRSGNYVGTMLHLYGERRLGERNLTPHQNFHVIDVLGGRIFTAPKAFTRRRADINAACEEIASRWSSL